MTDSEGKASIIVPLSRAVLFNLLAGPGGHCNGSLTQYVEAGKLGDLGQSVAAAHDDVAKGLEYLHGLSLVYCDIKPENLLMSADGNIKVCDFGLSKCKEDFCHTARLVGSTYWLGPEFRSVFRRKTGG